MNRRLTSRLALLALLAVAAPTSAKTLAGFFSFGGATLSQAASEVQLAAWTPNATRQPFAVQLFFFALCDCQAATCVDPSVLPQLESAWANGSIPMLTLMPYYCNASNDWIAASIANGTFNAQIDQWAALIRKFVAKDPKNAPDGRRVYVRPMHEMNGGWYPWGWTSDAKTPPATYRAAFRVFVERLRTSGATSAQLQVLWCINSRSAKNGWVADPDAAQWYPGDAWVDWAAVDGYNTPSEVGGKWEDVAFVFDGAVANIRTITTRPLAVPECGCDDAGVPANEPKKGAWLAELFCQYAAMADIRLLTYFNVEKPEAGSMHFWGVASRTYSGFSPYPDFYTQWVQCAAPNAPGGVNGNADWVYSTGQGLLLTDNQFQGRT
jgi:hypothetical protein